MPNKIDRDLVCKVLGETIVALRKRKGIAQEKLALEAGVERAHMSNIERGKYGPNLVTVYKLLRVMGITFIDFGVEFERTWRRLQKKPAEPPPAK